jgi:hypothetical protein
MNWLNLFKHLLPRAKAWSLTEDKPLRQFFDGLTVIGSDLKTYFDDVYLDIFPETTRQIITWEKNFAIPSNTSLTDQQRRDRIDAAWKATGGQSPGYIQDTLQNAGFNVYVHEWWEPIPGRDGGGAVDGDVTPVARDPVLYLGDASFLAQDGDGDTQDGDSEAQDGNTATPNGYLLVNKIPASTSFLIGDGSTAMQDGGAQAQEFSQVLTVTDKVYNIPTDPNEFPYVLYIGGETFPNVATVPGSRREEFENLCLKICPLEQWLGMLINYS